MLSRRDLLLGTMAGPVSAHPLDAAVAHLDKATRSGEVAAAVLLVEARGQRHLHAFGQARADTVFLLASITKPMTAVGLMALVDEGKLALADPVHEHLPGFTGQDRALVTIKHLLNHTSGLPDQLPDNLELRRRYAPLDAFVAGALRAPLRFPPGSSVAYQSMGFLLAAKIAEAVSRLPFRELLRRRVFQPLGMTGASLGLGGRKVEDTARVQVPDDPGGWNSPYWRDLGSPWGGAHATADSDQGYMTSVAFSPTLGHWIGLGLLQHGPQRVGEHVRAYDPVRGGGVEVEVCDPVFVDPERVRLNA